MSDTENTIPSENEAPETQEPETQEQGKARAKYTKRSKADVATGKVVQGLNVLQQLKDLTPEQRAALEMVAALQGTVAEQAEQGVLQTVNGEHPIIAALKSELKTLNWEEKGILARVRKLEGARLELAMFEKNAAWRREMIPWLESQIAAAEADIQAGRIPVKGERPEIVVDGETIERFDVKSNLKTELAALTKRHKAERAAEKAAREAANAS